VLDEVSFELPLYFDLLMMFSLLFATYSLYLILREMLGLQQDEADTQRFIESQQKEKENIVEKENGALTKLKDTTLDGLRMSGEGIVKGVKIFRNSLKSGNCVKAVSYTIDFIMIVCVLLKLASVIDGVVEEYD